MQISSRSLKSSFFNRRGFTIVELSVSIAIITLITTVVFVRYSIFDSTVLLKSVAYDIALTLREAQVKSISAQRASGGSTSFDFPFGVSFKPSNKNYTVFQYASSAPNAHPRYDFDIQYSGATDADPDPVGGDPLDYASLIQTQTIGRTMLVTDVCIIESNVETCSAGGVQRLDIGFRRPEYKGLFYAMTTGGPRSTSTVTSAKIKVGSTNGTGVFIVEVSGLGQISVKRQ